MKKNTNLFIAVAGLFIFAAIFINYLNMSQRIEEGRIIKISIIINDVDDTFWKNFKKGAGQGATDYNVDMTFVTLYDKNNFSQQETLLLREIDNKADAIIISPANNTDLDELLDSMGGKIPIISIGSKLESSKVVSNIMPNNEQMGEELAAAVGDDINSIDKIYIVTGQKGMSGKDERINSVKASLSDKGQRITTIRPLDDSEFNNWLDEKLTDNENFTLIALEESHLALAAQFIDKHQISDAMKLYGIGYNNRLVYYLENEVIKTIVAPDYYSMGYAAIEQAVNTVKDDVVDKEIMIGHSVVYPDTVYDKKNEMLLFPIG